MGFHWCLANVLQMPNREFKVALAVSSIVLGGTGVGVFAIWFQQQKTKSG